MSTYRVNPGWVLAILAWLGLIAASTVWLLRYSFAAGMTSASPSVMPAAVLGLALPLARPHLVLTLHPHCPCSRASVNELAKIISRVPNANDVTVLMFRPANESDAWLEGRLMVDCRRMGCRILPDPEGRIAESLGSLTSGDVVLYDATGALRYRGGITGSRGHEGDNSGERAVIEILQKRRISHEPLPVFGCPIHARSTNTSEQPHE